MCVWVESPFFTRVVRLIGSPTADRLNFEDLLKSRVFAAHPSTVLVRRKAMLERIGLVDEEIPGSYGEDYEWLLRAARRARRSSSPRRWCSCAGTPPPTSLTAGG